MFDPSKSKVVPPNPRQAALLGARKPLSRREMLVRCGTAFGALATGCTAKTNPIGTTSGGTSSSSVVSAPTFVQATGNGSTCVGVGCMTNNITVTLNPVTTGDYLVLAVAADNSSGGVAPTLTSTGTSVVWTQVLGIAAAGNAVNLYVYTSPSAPAGFSNVTAIFTTSAFAGAYSGILMEIAPVSGSTMTIDATGDGAGNSANWSVSTTTATTQPTDLMLGFVANAKKGITFNNPYLALFGSDVDSGGNADMNGATATVTNQAVQTMSGTLSGNANWAAVLLALYS